MKPNKPRVRILFVGEATTLSHVARPAVLARWAQEAGHEVIFACGKALHWVARDEGLEPLDLETVSGSRFNKRISDGRFFYTEGELENYIAQEQALLAHCRPDLVVSDFRLSMGVSAKLAEVPHLSLLNAYWSPAAECRFPAPSSGLLKWLPHEIRKVVFDGLRPMAFRLFGKPLARVYQRHGLRAPGDFRQLYSAGDECAYLDIPEMFPVQAVPHGHFFLGPVPWSPGRSIGLDESVREGETSFRNGSEQARSLESDSKSFAYVTNGSSGNADVLPEILSVLLKAGLNIFLSGVDGAEKETLLKAVPGLRGRSVVAKVLDPSSILKRCRMTVCPGGSGTVYQSLAQGVPLLCLPSNPDQGLSSQAVQERGAGLMLPTDRVGERNLARAVGTLLADDTFSRRAASMANSIERHHTRNKWLTYLRSKTLERVESVGESQRVLVPR